jgi:hypothetical protein
MAPAYSFHLKNEDGVLFEPFEPQFPLCNEGGQLDGMSQVPVCQLVLGKLFRMPAMTLNVCFPPTFMC